MPESVHNAAWIVQQVEDKLQLSLLCVVEMIAWVLLYIHVALLLGRSNYSVVLGSTYTLSAV